MKQEKAQFTNDSVFITLFYLLLLLNTVVRAELKDLHYIGDLSIGLTLFAMFFLMMKTWFRGATYDVPLTRIYVAIILFSALITLSFISTEYMDGYQYVQLIFHLLFILGAIRVNWNEIHLKIAAYIFGFATVIFFIHWIQSGFTLIGFKSLYGNENYMAVLLFSLFFFHILGIKLSRKIERGMFLLILAMNSVLIVTTSARSVLIGIFVIFIGWIILRSWRTIFSKLLYVVIAANFLFVGMYVGLKDTGLGDMLNAFSLTIFNKNLFSGRPEIWQGVIQAIMEKPFFGHGLGVKAHFITDTHLTSHNMYLQILLEFGLIGFFIFLLLIISIWTLLVRRLDHFVAKLSACFMLGILVYNMFEMTLFQNNYSIAFFQWLIMTIGIGFTSLKSGRP